MTAPDVSVHYLHGLAVGGVVGAFLGFVAALAILALLVAGRSEDPRIEIEHSIEIEPGIEPRIDADLVGAPRRGPLRLVRGGSDG